MVKPKLVSFKLCPFVQRSVITLEEKQVDYDITFIDLANKPDWFLAISPFGKVPVLEVGDTVIFESAVINEFLDETHGPSLHPQSALWRAHNRAWIEFGSDLIMTQYRMHQSEDEESFKRHLKAVQEKLSRLEGQLGEGPYFNGAAFSLVDSAYAPLFMRFDLAKGLSDLDFYEGFPKTAAWARALAARRSVQNSVVPEFSDLYRESITGRHKFFSSIVCV